MIIARRSMPTIASFWCLCVLVVFGYGGCSANDGVCYEDYNCPKGQYCVARQCQDTPPPGLEQHTEPTAATEPQVTPDEYVADSGTSDQAMSELIAHEPEPTACSNRAECADPNIQYCRFKQCTVGYIWFDFTSGHPIVDLAQEEPPRQCTSHAQCPSWQKCYSPGQCLTDTGRNSEARGGLLGEGIFLKGRSYTELINIENTAYVRIVMIGEFSEKLQKNLEIDIPLELVKSGAVLDIANHPQIQIHLYDVHIEFYPPTRNLLAVGNGGVISLATVSTKIGSIMGGSADIVFKKYTK